MAQVQKEAGKKRGEGPVVVTFASQSNQDMKRVGDGVLAVVVANRKGNKKAYSLEKIPQSVRDQLAAFALASRVKTYVNNNAEGADTVLGLADYVYNEFLNGKIYTRGEGAEKAGRKFDPSIYVDAMRIFKAQLVKAKAKDKDGNLVKPADEKQLGDFGAKLEAMTPKERTAAIKTMRSNKIYDKALAQIKMQKIEVSNDDMTDLF